ncbi:MAG: diguanylate cyclase [Moorea sp. SIO2B7]|nr:diguanylate cyclase [Moorena sp. SIO2B7]
MMYYLLLAKIKQLKIAHSSSDVSKYITLSLGVASIFPNQKLSPEFLISNADNKLYEAKNQGRDRISIWEEQLIIDN